MRDKLLGAMKENRSFFLFIALMFVFRSTFADWNTVPTGSMKPTILEGDRILVNRMVYDLRIPFTHISLYKVSDPVRGDVVVFDSVASGNKLVKRIVGIPGDIVGMENNILSINGVELTYEEIGSSDLVVDQVENLMGVNHLIRVNELGSPLSSFDPVVVPEGYYLALGDNRDNSADSRVIGFVPRDEIVGRSRMVVMSFDYDNYYIPRSNRFFHTL